MPTDVHIIITIYFGVIHVDLVETSHLRSLFSSYRLKYLAILLSSK